MYVVSLLSKMFVTKRRISREKTMDLGVEKHTQSCNKDSNWVNDFYCLNLRIGEEGRHEQCAGVVNLGMKNVEKRSCSFLKRYKNFRAHD